MSSRNIFVEHHITLRDLPDEIRFCQRHKHSLMILGGAGLGKSASIKQCADMLFGQRPDNMVDFRLADKEPSDASGVQIPVTDDNGETRTVYAIPDFWPRDPDWKGIIFLDELLHAEPYLQKLAFQIMLDRKIGTYTFPEGAVMVGAGNRSGDGTSVFMMEAPLANRMIIVELTYDTSVFIQDFAILNDVHPSIIGYLSVNVGDIENYEAMAEIGCPSFATPRTWVTASNILWDYDAGLLSSRLAQTNLQGCIGTTLAKQLWAYHTRIANLTPIEDIMSGKVTEHSGASTTDVLWMYGSQGNIWLRKAIANRDNSDDKIIEFSSNFLMYMHNNFKDMNKDFVSSIFMSFLVENAYGKALLMDGTREKLPAKLLQKCPVVMEIITEYRADYQKAVEEIVGKVN